MTAEIAVLNRNAVALAADSAVTLQLPEGPKIYNANKLFTLSKYRPVGIMIYGGADFLGIPWETIIKQYRKKLGSSGFATVDQYAKDFLSFVESRTTFFPVSRQERAIYEMTLMWVHRLRSRLKKAVELQIKNKGPVTDTEVRTIFNEILSEDISHLKNHKVLPRLSKVGLALLLRRFGQAIRKALKDGLQNLTDSIPMRQLLKGAGLAILRDLYWYSESGIVIAGFGEDEFLPSLSCHTLDAIILGRLRMREDISKRAHISNTGETASVIAFAQSEMVSLFMNGIDDDYAQFVNAFATSSFTRGFPDAVGKILEKHLNDEQRKDVLESIRSIGQELSSKLGTSVREYAKIAHSDPIIEIVNHLPKEELAAMAEALVNLTSFKRHVTRQAETVGGPIDVAVISRGDGFIWIKRKHYFTKELNPHFLSNYFRNEN